MCVPCVPGRASRARAVLQATLQGWLQEPDVLKSIISEHIVQLSPQATPPLSSDLTDGDRFRTLNGQGIQIHIKHPTANPKQNDYFVQNSDGSAYTRIVKPDQVRCVASNPVRRRPIALHTRTTLNHHVKKGVPPPQMA